MKIDPQDIETLIKLLNGNSPRKEIVNYIREYILPIKPKINYEKLSKTKRHNNKS